MDALPGQPVGVARMLASALALVEPESHAAGSLTRHTSRAETGSIRIRPFSPYPLFVTSTDPSESVTRLRGKVPTVTWRPAGRMRQPDGSSIAPSRNGPGTRRVVRTAAPATAGSKSRRRLNTAGISPLAGAASAP